MLASSFWPGVRIKFGICLSLRSGGLASGASLLFAQRADANRPFSCSRLHFNARAASHCRSAFVFMPEQSTSSPSAETEEAANKSIAATSVMREKSGGVGALVGHRSVAS